MRYAWLCHPVTVTGVIVLPVNDHLLKQLWPGSVTGKLSDVAGLLVAPPLLALLLRRRADLAATALTGALFALVKTTETGAEVASQTWTPSWRARRGSWPTPQTSWRCRPSPSPGGHATAPARPPPPAAPNGRILVYADDRTLWTSEDRGATWSADRGPHDDLPPRIRTEAEEARPPQSAACVPHRATRCYRVAPGRMAVEESDDGGRTWQPSWSLSEDDRERLTRRYRGSGPIATAVARVYPGFAAATCLSVPGAADAAWLGITGSMDGLRFLSVLMIPVGLVVCGALLIAGRARPAPVAVGVLASPLVYLTVYLPFQGWAAGTPGAYGVAVALATLLTGLVSLGCLALVRKDAKNAAP
ncbi:MAG TPA: hypothetical protein VFV66_00410 [Nonomuraea sp.]|nr:hypothetical protein [Nonomuraea sp.]